MMLSNFNIAITQTSNSLRWKQLVGYFIVGIGLLIIRNLEKNSPLRNQTVRWSGPN